MKGNTIGRLFVATALLLSVAIQADAQWRYGFKAGVMRSRGTSNSIWDRNDKWGSTIGGVVKYNFNDWVALQGELNYALRGFQTDLFTITETKPHNWLFNFHYIDLPVLAKVYPGALPFFIEVGPQVGYLVGFGENVKGANVPASSSRSDYNKWDASMVFGLGIETEIGLFFDLRYNLGLTKTASTMLGFRHRGLEITAGYLF